MTGSNPELPKFTLVANTAEGPKDIEATPSNTELYRHLGSLGLSQYDHAYTQVGAEGCIRVWRHNDHYSQVEAFMLAANYPLHDNLRKVNAHDVEAYDQMIAAQSGDLDHIPEDWA